MCVYVFVGGWRRRCSGSGGIAKSRFFDYSHFSYTAARLRLELLGVVHSAHKCARLLNDGLVCVFFVEPFIHPDVVCGYGALHFVVCVFLARAAAGGEDYGRTASAGGRVARLFAWVFAGSEVGVAGGAKVAVGVRGEAAGCLQCGFGYEVEWVVGV